MLRNPNHVREEYLTVANNKNDRYGGPYISQNVPPPTHIIDERLDVNNGNAIDQGMNAQPRAYASLSTNNKRPLTIYDEDGYVLAD